MALEFEKNRCAICQKGEGQCACHGCNNSFCIRHFNEHRQQLSIAYDDEVVRIHDELLEKINQVDQLKASSSELFDEIDRWETTTLDKVHKAAERARYQLNQLLNQEKDTLTKEFGNMTKEIRNRRVEDRFDEDVIKKLRQKMNVIQISLSQLVQPEKSNCILVKNDGIDWNQIIYVEQEVDRNDASNSSSRRHVSAIPKRGELIQSAMEPKTVLSFNRVIAEIPVNARWVQNGVTIAGGNGGGSATNQLREPESLFLDDDQMIVIADSQNHRIVQWKMGNTNGQVIAGGNGGGSRLELLNEPTDVLVDRETDSLIVCDWKNRRVVRWSRRSGTRQGEILIDNIDCLRLAMDEQRYLYVSDVEKHEVRRYQTGDKNGTLVAGGNGKGAGLNQLNWPSFMYIDSQQAVYVSECQNHRVTKWNKGAKEGIVVAGGQGEGNALTQLSRPNGLCVDTLGTLCVADYDNHRVMRWLKGAKQGTVIVGGNGQGSGPSQFKYPSGLSFDRQGNLCVVDILNHRVQRFSIQ